MGQGRGHHMPVHLAIMGHIRLGQAWLSPPHVRLAVVGCTGLPRGWDSVLLAAQGATVLVQGQACAASAP